MELVVGGAVSGPGHPDGGATDDPMGGDGGGRASSGPDDEVDLRAEGALRGALRSSASELDRAVTALEEAQRELGAAEAALGGDATPAVRAALAALLPEVGRPAMVLDGDDRVVLRTREVSHGGVPDDAALRELAASARRTVPHVVEGAGARALAVGPAGSTVVVLLDG
ncbi:MAG: hypothetical protein KDB04_19385 [Acidimicrobiales bacterium]|nr:hypothetical protein [Acidimicrobiales bacterium]HRW39347.1 hypothetical protein [Aquihabitans sp.]